MNTRYLFAIAASAAIVLATSCSADQEEPTQANVEIKLRADVNNMAVTRAGTSIQSTQFDYAENSPEYINVEIIDNNDVHPKANASYARASYIFKTKDVSGGLTPYSTTPYFPNTGNNVNIYAYYPSTVGTVGSGLTTTLPGTFTVSFEQSVDAHYKASDLMYGVPTNGNPVSRTSSGDIQLSFSHKLSKIVVELVADGYGLQTADLVGATVSMKAMISAPVAVDGTVTSQTWTATAAQQGDPVATTVNMGTVAQNSSVTTKYETAAIVVPQTIAANSANVFTITLADGAVYNYTPTSALTLQSGNVHVFTMTLGLNSISVSATINQWGNGTGDSKTLIL